MSAKRLPARRDGLVEGRQRRRSEDVGDLSELVGTKAPCRQGRRTDPHPGEHHRRARVERHGVGADGDAGLVQSALGLLSVQLRVPEVHQDEMNVRVVCHGTDVGLRQPVSEDPGPRACVPATP